MALQQTAFSEMCNISQISPDLFYVGGNSSEKKEKKKERYKKKVIKMFEISI